MAHDRPINPSAFVHDIRSRMDDSELMRKYGLSSRKLRRLYQRLVAGNIISHKALYERSPLYKDIVDRTRLRRAPRVDLSVALWIYEVGSSASGLVRDISSTGLRVAGIKSEVGETKAFQLPVDMFIGFDPLLFTAQCTWVELKGKKQKYFVGGYKITDISDKDQEALKKLIQLLLLSKSGEWKSLK